MVLISAFLPASRQAGVIYNDMTFHPIKEMVWTDAPAGGPIIPWFYAGGQDAEVSEALPRRSREPGACLRGRCHRGQGGDPGTGRMDTIEKIIGTI